jgi:aspartate aminotransferase
MFAMGALMDQGDEIIIPEPFMQITTDFQASGVTVVPVISTIETGLLCQQ